MQVVDRIGRGVPPHRCCRSEWRGHSNRTAPWIREIPAGQWTSQMPGRAPRWADRDERGSFRSPRDRSEKASTTMATACVREEQRGQASASMARNRRRSFAQGSFCRGVQPCLAPVAVAVAAPAPGVVPAATLRRSRGGGGGGRSARGRLRPAKTPCYRTWPGDCPRTRALSNTVRAAPRSMRGTFDPSPPQRPGPWRAGVSPVVRARGSPPPPIPDSDFGPARHKSRLRPREPRVPPVQEQP